MIFTNSMSIFILFHLKHFIHSPIQIQNRSKLPSNLNFHTEISGCRVMDKIRISETANHSGMKNALNPF